MHYKPFCATKVKILQGYVNYCLSAHRTHNLIKQAMTSIPFRAASSTQPRLLVNVFVYLFCLFCRHLFSAPRPIESLRLIDWKRFWLLPEKQDWHPWDGKAPAWMSLSFVDVQRASKIAEVWCVYELALTLRDRTYYTVRNVCFTAVVCSMYWMVFISS